MENKKRLIDANALKEKAKYQGHCIRPLVTGYHMCVSVSDIDNAPTVDAVEVVRCKDCEYWKCIEGGFGDCTHPRFHLEGHADPTMNWNDFCSCGERRGGD